MASPMIVFFLQAFVILTAISLIGAALQWLANKIGARIND